MNKAIRFKLSIMMFLQYFVWGAWYVTMGTYLNETLKFPGGEIGLAYGTTAIAAMISPFFVGMIADRFFATEKILSVLHLLGGASLYYASTLTEFRSFYPVLIIHTLCYMPTLALTNSFSFHQMRDPGKEFPAVRVLGTIGWIVAGLVVGTAALWGKKIETTSIPMKVGAIAAFVMGIYCLFLPHTPPKQAGSKMTVGSILGLDALQLMKDRSFAIFVIGSFLICIPLQFYYAFTNAFLNEIGVQNAAGKMTLGQMSELFFMLVMPLFFVRLGVKRMLLFGMLAWAARYLLFAFGNNQNMVWMLYSGIVLHGICYDFFFVTGQIYVDKKAGVANRGAAQGFIAFVTLGVGMFIGSWASGLIVQNYTHTVNEVVVHDWNKIWIIPAIGAGVVMLLFAFFFKYREETSSVTAAEQQAVAK